MCEATQSVQNPHVVDPLPHQDPLECLADPAVFGQHFLSVTLMPDVRPVTQVSAATTKDKLWEWGGEDLEIGLYVLLVKMAYRVEGRFDMRTSHYLEVTK